MSDVDGMRDYELKLEYLTRQYDRLWARFNFFLTVELALFGYAGYLLFDANVPRASVLPISLGLVVSALWYAVGSQDRALVQVYRKRATKAAEAFSTGYGANHAGAEVGGQYFDWRSWYLPSMSVTRLPATIAILVFIIWIGMLLLMRCIGWTLPPAWARPTS
jgi:hypothetical protein